MITIIGSMLQVCSKDYLIYNIIYLRLMTYGYEITVPYLYATAKDTYSLKTGDLMVGEIRLNTADVREFHKR